MELFKRLWDYCVKGLHVFPRKNTARPAAKPIYKVKTCPAGHVTLVADRAMPCVVCHAQMISKILEQVK